MNRVRSEQCELPDRRVPQSPLRPRVTALPSDCADRRPRRPNSAPLPHKRDTGFLRFASPDGLWVTVPRGNAESWVVGSEFSRAPAETASGPFEQPGPTRAAQPGGGVIFSRLLPCDLTDCSSRSCAGLQFPQVAVAASRRPVRLGVMRPGRRKRKCSTPNGLLEIAAERN